MMEYIDHLGEEQLHEQLEHNMALVKKFQKEQYSQELIDIFSARCEKILDKLGEYKRDPKKIDLNPDYLYNEI